MSRTFHLNIPITKVDEEQRIVTGIATSESVDSQGDIIDFEASKKAFSDWVGNIREMHDPTRAIGKRIDVQFDDDKKEVILSAKISESADGENAWVKVKEGILTGFSIGGQIFKITKDKAVKGANRIVDYALSETSLVDNPANPDAQLIMVKSKNGGLVRTEQAVNLKKSVWDAGEAIRLATELSYLIMTEQYEHEDEDTEQVQGLIEAFNRLRDFAAKEVVEGDDYILERDEVMELAQKAINLSKGEGMATKSKKVEKSSVVGGEDRDANANVELTAEDTGRPLNDTRERAEENGVPEAGTPVKTTDENGEQVVEAQPVVHKPGSPANPEGDTNVVDEKAKEEHKDSPTVVTPPEEDDKEDEAGSEENDDVEEEKVTEEDAPAEPETEGEGGKGKKKAAMPADLVKSIQTLVDRATSGNGAELQKVADLVTDLSAKVEKSMTSLEERVKSLENQPVATKSKSSYYLAEKGDEGDEEVQVTELKKRQEHLIAHPQDAKPGEMEQIYRDLRKAKVGERIEVK